MWKEFVYQNIFPINIDTGMMFWRVAGEPWEEAFMDI